MEHSGKIVSAIWLERNDDLSISCLAAGDGYNYFLKWIRLDRNGTVGRNVSGTISKKRAVIKSVTTELSVLVLKNIQREDTGLYRCVREVKVCHKNTTTYKDIKIVFIGETI